GINLPVFLLADGKLNGKPTIEKPLLLGQFFSRYYTSLPEGAKEPLTTYMEKKPHESLRTSSRPQARDRFHHGQRAATLHRRTRQGVRPPRPAIEPRHDPQRNRHIRKHL